MTNCLHTKNRLGYNIVGRQIIPRVSLLDRFLHIIHLIVDRCLHLNNLKSSPVQYLHFQQMIVCNIFDRGIGTRNFPIM